MKSVKVIIVEDELIAAEFLKQILESIGVTVLDIVDSGKEAIRQCLEKKPDIVFMDIMLSDSISGSEAALTISRQNDQIKIVFLTAFVDDEMVDYAAQSNAVAYLTKPYNEVQIKATMQLLLKQTQTGVSPKTENEPRKVYLINGYIYDTERKRLFKDKKEIELGPTGIKLLELLCSQPGISISKEQISMHVWGKEVNDKTLRSLMFRIRSVTDDELIKNVSGTGYKVKLNEG